MDTPCVFKGTSKVKPVADIQVQCVKCGLKRRLSEAFSEEGREELAHCKGRLPHLRKFDEDACDGRQRAILLGASNSWFPIMLSVLSIRHAFFYEHLVTETNAQPAISCTGW